MNKTEQYLIKEAIQPWILETVWIWSCYGHVEKILVGLGWEQDWVLRDQDTGGRERDDSCGRCWKIEHQGLPVPWLHCRTQLWAADLQALKDSHPLCSHERQWTGGLISFSTSPLFCLLYSSYLVSLCLSVHFLPPFLDLVIILNQPTM